MTSESLPRRRARSGHANLTAHGEPWVWLTASSLALAIAMIVGLLSLIAWRGLATFWPVPLELVTLADGRLADVAPTLLDLMGLEQPAEMTGRSLIRR